MRDSIKRRIDKLEGAIRMCHEPETLEEIIKAFERGDYGYNSLIGIVVSIEQHGGVDHLRGEYPDRLVDYWAGCIREAEQEIELEGTGNDTI
jgi:hypothetical protein